MPKLKPKSEKKIKKTGKGTPSALLISIAVHAVILLLAGGLVVFSAIKKKEKKFVPPPPVDRPKMDLKKPRVKVKKESRPRATTRIASKSVASMPDIQLPDISSAGSGLSGGVSGYELVPDVSAMSVFGGSSSVAVGNDFEGTFYSLRYDRRGQKANMDDPEFRRTIRRFVEMNWNPFVFAPYYRSPQKLYTTQIFIPTISSEFAPSYFGIPSGPDFDPVFWCVHYKGKIMRKEGGRFRFWGFGDDVLLVRVNGELVLNASWGNDRHEFSDWERQDEDYKYFMGHAQAAAGQWFELEPGVPVEMEVLVGEIPGGFFCAYLVIEDESVDYAENRQGMPILPVFKTAEIPDRVKDKIKYTLIDGEADLDSELMFNVY
ncbi:hypothetical protein [Pontiella sp.]|uniref:hypothetical protein n=1 Tax=Pontiella sp. TaxID=2837462 RepID=UPI0035690FDF